MSYVNNVLLLLLWRKRAGTTLQNCSWII